MRDKDQILLEEAYQSIYEKRKIHDELIRLDEMAGWSTGTYRSMEDQWVLDELMERDDWEDILTGGTRDIANLTPNQKRVIKNYKAYMWNIDPMNAERRQEAIIKYRQSEKGTESRKKVYGAGATQTEEEKAAAKRRQSKRRKFYTRRPIVKTKLKKYQDEYKSNPENQEKIKKYQDEYHKNPIVKARKKLYASQPEVRAKKNQSERDRRSRNRDKINRRKRELRLLKKQKESNN